MRFPEAEGSDPLTRKEDLTVKTASFLPKEQLGKGKRWILDPTCQSKAFQACLRSVPQQMYLGEVYNENKRCLYGPPTSNSGASCTLENSLHALPTCGC